MKRGGFGAVLLAALLVLGIISALAMDRLHSPLADTMEEASAAALAGDWHRAAQLTGEVHASWEKGWRFSACFADHGPMEQIDRLFSQLEVYRAAEDPLAFAVVCASLQTQLEAMGDAHKLNWWNLL